MLLIDAFNVLHLPQAVVEGHALDVADLARLIGQSRYAGQAVVLVCDAAGDGSVQAPRAKRAKIKIAGVEIVFSGHGRSADDEIELRLRRGAGHGVTVVSDDRRLRRAASRAGAKSLASPVFLAHVLMPREIRGKGPLPEFVRDIPLDKYSVAHWMRAFGLSPAELLDRTGDVAGLMDKAKESPESVRPARSASDGSKSDAPRPRRRVKGMHKPKAGPEAPRADETLPSSDSIPVRDLADDPIIREAIEAWQGRLRAEDLDMGRWLDPPG